MVITTINNTLCRVVEPEPLTETATFPCVVRLIQDDSPMGRYNLKLRNTTLEPLVVTGIAKDIGVVTHLVPHPHFSCECYEIIGYPVEEGSAEWRNYQLRNGKCVFRPKDSEYYQAGGQGRIIGRLVSNGEFNSTWNVDTFMRDDSDGWQLYEEPAPFKVGDWVEASDGQHLRVTDADQTAFHTSHDVSPYNIGRFRQVDGKSAAGHCEDSNEFLHNAGHILRKLDPSEVVIRIGCLEGTVEKVDDDRMFIVHKDGHTNSCIMLAMLNTPTRELVKALLKAQEEK